MNAIMFDEKTKAAEITYQQLAQTMEIGDGTGDLPKQCPVQAGTLIKNICHSIKQFSDLDAEVKPIVIREPYCQVNRKSLNEGKQLQLEDYLIRRLVTKIDLPLEAFQESENHLNASIAMTYIYTDGTKGIQIAFGENVNVCDNLSVFGGFQFSTYGNSKVSFEDGMQLMHHWLQNIRKVHDQHIEVIQRLMNTKVAKMGFQRIIGSLFEKAVRFNSGEKIVAPLNQTQIGEAVKFGMPVLKEKEDKDTVTGWEIMNWGTSVLKPHNSDMIGLLKDTADFNTFLLKEFKIPMEIEI